MTIFDPAPAPSTSPPPPDHDPFASPTTPRVESVAQSTTELVPGWNGRRIAGGLLIVHAFTTCIDALVSIRMGDDPSPRIVVPIIIDIVIGGSLLAGQDRFLGWAILRAALGAVAISLVQAAQGNYCAVPLQLMASGALLGLLVGDAGKPRMLASLATYAAYLVLFVGLVSMFFVSEAMGTPATP